MGDRFDAEVETALADPKMTYALAEKVKRYPEWARRQLTARAHQTAQQWRNEVTAKTGELVPRLGETRDRYAEIEAAIDAGELSAVEAVDALNNLRQKVAAEERRYDALSTQHTRADAVHAEPVAHMEHLYETYPSLQRGRPTLNDYLAQQSPSSEVFGLPEFRGPQP